MTTTSRRPPATTPKGTRTQKGTKGRPRRRPADAAPAASAKAAPPRPAAPRRPPAKTTGTTTGTGAAKRATKTAKAPARTAKTASASAAAKTAARARHPADARTSASRRARRTAVRRRTQAPRTPFVLLIVGLLGGALVSLLLLNTVLAKDAFTLTRLQQRTKQLEQQRQAYEAEIARESSPEGLSNKAKALGMKEAEDPAFFDARTGRAGDGDMRRVPDADAAAAGAAGVAGVPGAVVPGAGAP
ncbi:MAG TPA: hypothetical protein VIL71_10085 [Spirillospora sp.]